MAGTATRRCHRLPLDPCVRVGQRTQCWSSCAACGCAASGTHLLADVAGYFTDSTATSSASGLFQALEPGRVLGTRDTGSKPGDQSTTALNVLSPKALPAPGVSGVVLNVTAVGTTGAGYVQVFPTGRATPAAPRT